MSDRRYYVTFGVPYVSLLRAFLISLVSHRWELQDLRSEMRGELEALRLKLQGAAAAAVEAKPKVAEGGDLGGHTQRVPAPNNSLGKK